MTLFRLSLNVSTTRSILSHGEGGKVVETFGNFVVGGNVLVGLVVFIILIIIQFIVITKAPSGYRKWRRDLRSMRCPESK
ncbi:FHIPEP family type III secretion protein [Bacillus velezensis]|nr:FHIPEP family type III secretion protein [Bacillus velezensis]